MNPRDELAALDARRLVETASPELAEEYARLADAIDGICSIESWVSLTRIHDRSPDEVRRTWTTAVTTLVTP